MVNQTDKFLRKLDHKRFKKVRQVSDKIENNALAGLDVKPLKDQRGLFRCRVGDIRIIFRKASVRRNDIVEINFRGSAYKK